LFNENYFISTRGNTSESLRSTTDTVYNHLSVVKHAYKATTPSTSRKIIARVVQQSANSGLYFGEERGGGIYKSL